MSIHRQTAFLRIFIFALLVFPAVLAAHSEPALPEGLNSDDWAQIEQQIQSARFSATPAEMLGDGWNAVNAAHDFAIEYRADGQTVLTVDQAAHTIAVQLESYGYGDELIDLTTAPNLSANGNTVTYQWKPGLREWWVNSERGVEQWFELAERPRVTANEQPLVVAMQLDSTLNATVVNNALKLTSTDGSTAIIYDRLKVWDATGKILPAHMHLEHQRLALQVDDTDAVYPVTIDPTFAQQAYLKASNTEAFDGFGSVRSLAVSANTVVVGASSESSDPDLGNQTNNDKDFSGAAYVFVRDGVGNWTQQGFLKASNADAFDSFGHAVAIDGDRIVVSANQESGNAVGGPGNNDLNASGAAYVFERTGGVWSETAYLKAFNPDTLDRWGSAVAVSGDTIVVTSNAEDSAAQGIDGNQADNSARDAGAAYVFVRDGGGNWLPQAYIKASNAGCNDLFGGSVALDGNTLVVGASNEGNTAACDASNAPPGSGATYVFVRDGGGNWTEQAFLKASNPDDGDRFGGAVAVDGDIVIVGAWGEDSSATGVNGNQGNDVAADDSGAAYVFTRDGSGNWSQQAYLKASDTDINDQFGFNVAVTGETVFVGARVAGAGSDGSGGTVYPFTRDGGGIWMPQPSIRGSNTESGDGFGSGLAVSGSLVAVSAPFEASDATGVDGDDSDNSAFAAGAAYVFDLAFTIGGTVSGLVGAGLELQNNGGDDLSINADGAFTFDTALIDGSAYAVTVATQPTGPSQTCSITNGTGTVSGMDVTNVQVNCVIDQFTVGGNVTGLTGAGLMLLNNGTNALMPNPDGSFTFPPQDDGTDYEVTVQTQPTGPSQTCSVTNGSGTLSGGDVTNVQVTCVTDQFTVGGSVTGLAGTGLVLQNNGGDDLAIASDGAFTFTTPLDDGSAFNVIVAIQPTNLSQTCTVSNGTGNLSGADVTNVQVNCVTDQFTVSGTITGLQGDQVVLQNNGGDDQVITADGGFTFAAQDDGTSYAVTVAMQPTNPSQTCTVSNGTGTLSGADVTDVQVTCVTDQFTVGGTVTGLNGTGLVLLNNGGDDLSVTADGAFTFATPLDDGSDYEVTVLTQPSTSRDQQCTVSNASGTLAGSDVTDVAVSCVDITLALSTNDQAFGLVLVGASGTATIVVTNTGTPDLTLDGISSPSEPFSITGGSCLPVPTTLAADETCTIEVAFTPDAVRDFSDQIVITSNATSSPDTVRLSGRSNFELLVVPTLNGWGLLTMMLLTFAIGGLVIRKPFNTYKRN
ncbi:MAG: choice-of-anchor D domain-containing protein [Pseudomonadota bacterium]